MSSLNFIENLEETMDWLHTQGAFLTVKNGDTVNTMTISWGQIGYQWRKPVFMVLVRKSRYTYELLENAKEFTVSIPFSKNLKQALTICGTKTGKDIDKFKECGLYLKEGNKISTPIIENADMHYECKVVYSHPIDINMINDLEVKKLYEDGNYHTLYYGEIVDIYKTK